MTGMDSPFTREFVLKMHTDADLRYGYLQTNTLALLTSFYLCTGRKKLFLTIGQSNHTITVYDVSRISLRNRSLFFGTLRAKSNTAAVIMQIYFYLHMCIL